jgi:quercetin dioxygenase-like cupin family protein
MNILKFIVFALLPLTTLADEPQPVSENTPVVATILQEQLAVWPDGEAIVTTLELPANFRFSDHYHPGEEVLYILEGEGWIHYPDQPGPFRFNRR